VARNNSKPLQLLHVEDSEDDAVILAKACERAIFPIQLHRVSDVETAQGYLLGEGDFTDRSRHPYPHLVILDLRLPRVDGFEFLKWLRAQQRFAALPVLVFTSSLSREDKVRALAHGASSYFVKPASFDALVQVVQCFGAPNPGN
jgi:DNA-binding response OmpR family regulator